MPITDVERLATQLHDAKLVNLDAPIRDLLRIDGVGQVNPGDVADSVAAWTGYVVVTKGRPAVLNEIESIGRDVRGAING